YILSLHDALPISYKNKKVAIKMEIIPNVGAFVAACNLVNTPGKRIIPKALENMKKVPASNKKMMIRFIIILISIAFNNNTHFNVFSYYHCSEKIEKVHTNN